MTTRRSTFWSVAAIAVLLLIGSFAVSGCNKPLDPQQYGQVLYKLPKVEGADEPYPLPELDKPPEENQ